MKSKKITLYLRGDKSEVLVCSSKIGKKGKLVINSKGGAHITYDELPEKIKKVFEECE